jgi:hypothetical protein
VFLTPEEELAKMHESLGNHGTFVDFGLNCHSSRGNVVSTPSGVPTPHTGKSAPHDDLAPCTCASLANASSHDRGNYTRKPGAIPDADLVLRAD